MHYSAWCDQTSSLIECLPPFYFYSFTSFISFSDYYSNTGPYFLYPTLPVISLSFLIHIYFPFPCSFYIYISAILFPSTPKLWWVWLPLSNFKGVEFSSIYNIFWITSFNVFTDFIFVSLPCSFFYRFKLTLKSSGVPGGTTIGWHGPTVPVSFYQPYIFVFFPSLDMVLKYSELDDSHCPIS